MEKKSNQKIDMLSQVDTSMDTAGDRLLKRLKEKGYSNDKVGQAFAMKWTPPKKIQK